jgi:hypothetical protein
LRGGRARERAWAEAQIEKILIAAENAHDRVGQGASRPT